jgi:hypothetical protein
MSNEAAAALAILVTCVLAAVKYWNEYLRRIPIEEFGLDAVHRALRWESDYRRNEILSRGWMTSREWTLMIQRQLDDIDSQLDRRDEITEKDSKQ